MTRRRASLAVSVAALLLAACGGGDESGSDTTAAPTTAAPTTAPPTTAPPTTQPAPTTAPQTTEPAPTTAPPTTEPELITPVLTDAVAAENGFLTVQPVEDWLVINVLPETQRTYEDEEGLSFEASPDSLVELVALASPDGTVQIAIGREGRHLLAPGVLEWDSQISDLIGIQPNIDVTVEWGGGSGESTFGRLGPAWVRHDSVAVGGHLVTVIAISETQPTSQVSADVDAMIESITIDPSALPPLTHALDTTVSTTDDDTGSTHSISVLVPPSWTMPVDATDLVWFAPEVDPDTGGTPYIQFLPLSDGSPVDDVMTAGLVEWAGFFDLPPEVEALGDLGGAQAVVAWEGRADQAVAAYVIVSDGIVAHQIFMWTPGDPATLQEMVASILINDSALLP